MEDFDVKALCARLSDLALASERGVITHTVFLTPAELRTASNVIQHMGYGKRVFFFGGYKGAERKCIFFLPDYYEELISDLSDTDAVLDVTGDEIKNVIKPLSVKGSGFRVLTHRDYLGSVLNLGIERSSVGDLCPTDDASCVIFALAPVADLILLGCEKVASDKVTIRVKDDISSFTYERKTKAIADTVASDRFDCVVSSLIGESRERAKEKILAGICELCDAPCTRTDERVSPGDTVTVHGHGKFIIYDITEETKKGRIRLSAAKYI